MNSNTTKTILWILVGIIVGLSAGFVITFTPIVFNNVMVIKALLAFAYAILIYTFIASFAWISWKLIWGKR